MLSILIVAWLITRAVHQGRAEHALAQQGIVPPRMQARWGDQAAGRVARYGLTDHVRDAWSDGWSRRTAALVAARDARAAGKSPREAAKAVVDGEPAHPGPSGPPARRDSATPDAVSTPDVSAGDPPVSGAADDPLVERASPDGAAAGSATPPTPANPDPPAAELAGEAEATRCAWCPQPATTTFDSGSGVRPACAVCRAGLSSSLDAAARKGTNRTPPAVPAGAPTTGDRPAPAAVTTAPPAPPPVQYPGPVTGHGGTVPVGGKTYLCIYPMADGICGRPAKEQHYDYCPDHYAQRYQPTAPASARQTDPAATPPAGRHHQPDTEGDDMQPAPTLPSTPTGEATTVTGIVEQAAQILLHVLAFRERTSAAAVDLAKTVDALEASALGMKMNQNIMMTIAAAREAVAGFEAALTSACEEVTAEITAVRTATAKQLPGVELAAETGGLANAEAYQ